MICFEDGTVTLEFQREDMNVAERINNIQHKYSASSRSPWSWRRAGLVRPVEMEESWVTEAHGAGGELEDSWVTEAHGDGGELEESWVTKDCRDVRELGY